MSQAVFWGEGVFIFSRAKDLLTVNKTDLADMVRADLGVMDRDAKKMRGEGPRPTVFACIKDREGLEAIVEYILRARERALLSEARERAI